MKCLIFSVLAIKSGPTIGVQVYVKGLAQESDQQMASNVLTNTKWVDIESSWQEVNWNKLEGKNFLHKIELLMAALTK